jgi:hypothetical protein
VADLEARAVDRAGDDRLESLVRLAAGADQLDVLLGVDPVVGEQLADQEVVAAAELATGDRLALEVLGGLDALADTEDVRLPAEVRRQVRDPRLALDAGGDRRVRVVEHQVERAADQAREWVLGLDDLDLVDADLFEVALLLRDDHVLVEQVVGVVHPDDQ